MVILFSGSVFILILKVFHCPFVSVYTTTPEKNFSKLNQMKLESDWPPLVFSRKRSLLFQSFFSGSFVTLIRLNWIKFIPTAHFYYKPIFGYQMTKWIVGNNFWHSVWPFTKFCFVYFIHCLSSKMKLLPIPLTSYNQANNHHDLIYIQT